MIIAIAVVVALVLGGVGYAANRGGPSTTTSTTTTPSTSGPTTTAPTTSTTTSTTTTRPTTTTTTTTTTTLGAAPQLVVNQSDGQTVFVEDIDPRTGFAVTGKTDVGATVTVNNIAAVVNADGTWQLFTNLAFGDNVLTIVARRPNSAPTEKKLTIRAAPRPTTTTTLPTVTAVNDAFALSFQGDGAVVSLGNLFANDRGVPVLAGFTQSNRGAVAVAPNGSATFTPATNGTYVTSFQYTICAQGNAGSCSTATVTLNVTCNKAYPAPAGC